MLNYPKLDDSGSHVLDAFFDAYIIIQWWVVLVIILDDFFSYFYKVIYVIPET